MLSFRNRAVNTMKVIENSNAYNREENYQLFNQGISILSRRIRENDNSEFSEKESDVLVAIFTIINGGF